MKTCPECGIALKDEYQFCPEDGASLDMPAEVVAQGASASAKAPATSAVVLYCPACAAEYPLTFSECPVHHTALIQHGMPALVDHPPRARRLHLVSPVEQTSVEATTAQPRRSGMEAYEAALESLVEPVVSDEAGDRGASTVAERSQQDERAKYRKAAMAIAVALALMAVVGIYALISNASRKPSKPAKTAVATTSEQQTITIPTPQAALDYQEQAATTATPSATSEATTATNGEARADARVRAERRVDEITSPEPKRADSRPSISQREPMAAPSPRPAPTVTAQTAMARQPAATELVLPRGTFGQVEARLTNVRAARTASGYRYELTFHLADQVGQATQWERLAITTHATSGATRQQQIPFYHRLGADGTMSFTVSVEMPGRAPADWQGRIICTSIGSDSSGRAHRASFGANVSPN